LFLAHLAFKNIGHMYILFITAEAPASQRFWYGSELYLNPLEHVEADSVQEHTVADINFSFEKKFLYGGSGSTGMGMGTHTGLGGGFRQTPTPAKTVWQYW
jgi:hypothetical protein